MVRFGDKYVTSIICYGKVILDEYCNLFAPTVTIDRTLTVDIGGTVNMPATTIDFTNSTIDFSGATLENFTGNISGNISGNLNVEAIQALQIICPKIYGNLYGNVNGQFVNATLITGTTCGTVQTSSIVEKVSGGGINVTGKLKGDFVGLLTGNVIGNIKTNIIQPRTGSTITLSASNTTVSNNLNVNGTVNATSINASGNITITNPSKYFIGNVCGNIYTNLIKPKNINSNIIIEGNINANKIYVSNIWSNSFYGSFFGNLHGNIFPLSTVGNFLGTFEGNSFGNFTGNVYGNVSGSIIDSKTVVGNVVCANTLQTDTIESKNFSYIIHKDIEIFQKNIQVVSNIIASNIAITNDLTLNPLSVISATFNGELITSLISQQLPNTGIIVNGNLNCNEYYLGNLKGTATLPSISATNVVYATTGGLLTGSASLTFNSGTGTLNATNFLSTSAITAGTTLSAGTTVTSGTNVIATNAITAGTTITSTSDITSTSGNVIINGSGRQLKIKGSTPTTDFIGQATLTAGTVTINNTKISSSDRVFVQRSAQNGSTAYGTFLVTISAGVSFTITSRKSDTTIETNDTSIVDYFIVRQL